MTNKESNKARQIAFIARKHEQGLTEVRGVWLPKELHSHIKEYAISINKKHLHIANVDVQLTYTNTHKELKNV